MAHMGDVCLFWPFSIWRLLPPVWAGVQGVTYYGLPFRVYCELWKSRFKPSLSETWVHSLTNAKTRGPYSRASASTLGTRGPSRQIGLISLESISCIPPFNLEINGALLLGVEEAHSAAIHRRFANHRASRGNWGLCVSGWVGPSICRFPFGVQKGASKSAGAKVGVGGAAEPESVQISA